MLETCYPFHLRYTHYVKSNCLRLITVFLSHRKPHFSPSPSFPWVFLFSNEMHWHHFWHICRVLRNEIIPAYLFVLPFFFFRSLYKERVEHWAPYENENRERHSIWSILIGFLFFLFLDFVSLNKTIQWMLSFRLYRIRHDEDEHSKSNEIIFVKEKCLYQCLRIANSIENELNMNFVSLFFFCFCCCCFAVAEKNKVYCIEQNNSVLSINHKIQTIQVSFVLGA